MHLYYSHSIYNIILSVVLSNHGNEIREKYPTKIIYYSGYSVFGLDLVYVCIL